MTIPLFLSTAAINRIVTQIYTTGLLPGIDGRLGGSDFLHACYSVRITALPSLETGGSGILSVRAPVEGRVSIPWGLGVDFKADAVADLGVHILDDRVEVEIAGLRLQDLRIGKGCTMPRDVINLIGPAMRGALVQILGGTGRISIPLPPLEVPLFELVPDAPPLEMAIRDISVIEQGIIMHLGQRDDVLDPNPWIPSSYDRDLVLVVSEGEAERLIAMALEGPGNEIAGNFAIPMPNPKMALDLVRASGETITSLGRRGLGRRSLEDTTRIKVNFAVNTGAPKVRFEGDGKIVIFDTPAHLAADAVLEMDVPKETWTKRILKWFRPRTERTSADFETTNVSQWNVNEDIRIVKVDAKVGNGEDGRPRWEITDLDIDLTLNWSLPEKTIESIADNIGKRIATNRLPTDLPNEFALPMGIPFKLKMERMEFMAKEGELEVRADVELVPIGDIPTTKQQIEEVFRQLVPPNFIGRPEVSWK
jgi:hypothetical protein